MENFHIDSDSAESLVWMFEQYLERETSDFVAPDFVLSGEFRELLVFFAKNRSEQNDYVLEWLVELQQQYLARFNLEEYEDKLESWHEWREQCDAWAEVLRKRSSERIRYEILSAR